MSGPLGPLLRLFPEIEAERWRQLKKFGVQQLPDGTGHPGDQALAVWHQAYTATEFRAGRGTWRDLLAHRVSAALAETERPALRGELLQLATAALGWVEDIDRRSGDREPRIVPIPLRRIAASRNVGDVSERRADRAPDRELVPV